MPLHTQQLIVVDVQLPISYCTFHLINMRAVFNLRHPKLKLSSAWDINMLWKCLFLFFLKKKLNDNDVLDIQSKVINAVTFTS